MKIREVLEALKFVQEIVMWNQEVQDFVPVPLEFGKDIISMGLHWTMGYTGSVELEIDHIFFAAGVLRIGMPQ